jgi:hypothetical protein
MSPSILHVELHFYIPDWRSALVLAAVVLAFTKPEVFAHGVVLLTLVVGGVCLRGPSWSAGLEWLPARTTR